MEDRDVCTKLEDTSSPSHTTCIFLRKIGQSHLGEVWKIQDPLTTRLYTLKIISKSRIAKIQTQFLREVSRLYQINHKNIIKIFYHYEHDDSLYLFMESIEGITLSQKLYIEKKFGKDMIIEYFLKVIDAIEYLHSLSPEIIYKYIKPENILVDSDQNLKLIDFCWASICNEGEVKEVFSSTLEYLAPEMFGKSDFTVAVDIWCLGVLLFEMSFGVSPFKNSSNVGLLSDIQHCKISYPIDADLVLKDLLEKILVKDPAQRIGLKQIRAHAFFFEPAVESGDSTEISAGAESFNSFMLLKGLQQKVKEESYKNQRKTKDIQTEIDCFDELVLRINEKIKVLDGVSLEIDKSIMDIEGNLKSSDEFIGNFAEPNTKALRNLVDLERRREKTLCDKHQRLSDMKQEKYKYLKDLTGMLNNAEVQLQQLYSIKADNDRQSNLKASSQSIFPFISELSPEELLLVNSKTMEYSSVLLASCEKLSRKIEDSSNIAYLNDRSLCELDILYHEKSSEMKNHLKFAKKNIPELKRKSSLSGKLREVLENNLRKALEDEKMSQGLDIEELNPIKEQISELKTKLNNLKTSIRERKKEIWKLKVKIANKNIEIKGKHGEVTNLIEDLMSSNLSLSINNVRRLF